MDIKGRLWLGETSTERQEKEASYPTSHTEAFFITAAIEAAEGRDVAIADLPNAFAQADLIKNDEEVDIIMIIRGQLADLLIEKAPDMYGPVATKDKKGTTVIYVQLLNALYGLVEACLIFY